MMVACTRQYPDLLHATPPDGGALELKHTIYLLQLDRLLEPLEPPFVQSSREVK